MNQLDGAVVVVTGASAGVGRATARAFAEQGARLALLARGSVGLEAAADDVRRAGGSVVAIPVDVSSAAQVTEAAERIEIELGPIDVWVNNAMTSVFAPFWDVEPDEFRHVTEVCYLGCVYGTQAALRSMRSRDTGVVIQVGSALAYRGIPLQSAYCGAKHAIQGFTESVRCELLDDGSNVRLTMVQLPAMNTPQFDWALSRLPEAAQPVPPIYQPEVAAEAIVHAALHPHRREHWVGGSTALTVLANAVAPGVLDRYLGRTGVRSQQTGEPNGRSGGNLWAPLDGPGGRDFGAHGRFDARSTDRSVQAALARHPVALTGVLAGAAGAVAVAVRARRR
jgi:NAD(P)-dependent dehydrogenase (short-subunit alcohol dehydrogenase family)